MKYIILMDGGVAWLIMIMISVSSVGGRPV